MNPLNNGQLNLFDQPSTVVHEAMPIAPDDCSNCGFTVGEQVQILRATAPLEYLNGQKAIVEKRMPGAVAVKVEGIVIALVLQPDAIKKWSAVNSYIDATEEVESANLIVVGMQVECSAACLGRVGIVRQIGMHFGGMVAWLDFGARKPLYPAPIETLNTIE
ncbi:MAG: hypothetical protein WCD18_10225 [Thermosynechococcaceae cyanobacterium]